MLIKFRNKNVNRKKINGNIYLRNIKKIENH